MEISTTLARALLDSAPDAIVVASDRGTLVASTIRDVSAHYDLERRLIEANRSKTRFLAAASHDLRQPVQSLVLLNRAASTPELDAAALRQIITKQQSSLRSIARILDALLDIGKLEAGLVLPEPSTRRGTVRLGCIDRGRRDCGTRRNTPQLAGPRRANSRRRRRSRDPGCDAHAVRPPGARHGRAPFGR